MDGLAQQHRLFSPSAERNKAPIADVLKRVLPGHGLVLEVSSGSGQHVAHFARELPHLTWQPTERSEENIASIAAWMEEQPAANINAPLRLDVCERPWPMSSAAAIVCLNMIHIAPWTAAEGLITGAGELLSPGGTLFLYGPYRRDGRHTAPSNEAFDQSLRSQNPSWGVRDLEDVARLAESQGFAAPDVYEMPANNLSVVFRKRWVFSHD